MGRRRSMFDEAIRCRLLGFMQAIDWRGCRVGWVIRVLGFGCCAVNAGYVPRS
jgi:hypothetical protein